MLSEGVRTILTISCVECQLLKRVGTVSEPCDNICIVPLCVAASFTICVNNFEKFPVSLILIY